MKHVVVNAIINRMLSDVLIVSDIRATRESSVYGYYTHVDKNAKDKFGVCVNGCITCGRKIMLGENNGSDTENTYANAITFIYECLYNLFMGELNERVDNDLKCNNINDIYDILDNHMYKLCRYVYSYVRNQFRVLLGAKSNPDFHKCGDKFQKNNYLYINDNVNHFNEYEIEDKVDNEVINEKTEYIIENYFNGEYLTNGELRFIDNVIEYGIAKGGNILDYDNVEIYSKQLVYKYKKKINKKLGDIVGNDMHIDIVNGIWILK